MLTIQTLGSFSARTSDGREYRPRKRECALLTYLACNAGRPLVREALADLFWPTVPSVRGLHSLSQAIYRLSKSIPELALEARPGELRLPPTGVRVDAIEFERAIRAADYARARDLYGGAFLDGMQLDGAPEFAAWQDQTRARLASAAELMFRELLSEAESNGDWQSAEACCEALRGFNPHDDLVACTHVGSLLARGARFEARRVYAQVRRTLQNAGKEPSSRLLRIAERLESEGAEDQPSQTSLKLVGRAREFDRLKALLTRAESGVGGAIIVSGVAGVGKTRLCQQLTRLAAIRGCRVFQCVGTPITRGVGFAGARELLNSARPGEVAGLPPAFQQKLAAGLLNSGPRIRDQAPSEPLDKWSLAEAAVSLLERVAASAPVVVFADDLQWVDDASTEMLHFIAHRLRGDKVLVLTAVRREEVREGSVAQEVIESPGFETLRLGELSAQGALDLLHVFSEGSIQPLSRAAVDEITRMAGGHPFFILELAKAYFREQHSSQTRRLEIPETVQHFITRRLSSLSPTALVLAEALAVVGGSARGEVLRVVTGLGENDYGRGTEELVAKGVCSESASRTNFVHDLVRERAYDQMVLARRVRYHARAVRALRGAGADPATLAYHSERADNPAETNRYATIAARVAEARYGPAEAEPFWRLAAGHASTRRLRSVAAEHLANCLFILRRNAEADSLYQELLALGGVEEYKTTFFRARRMAIAARSGTPPTDNQWLELFEDSQSLPSAQERVRVFECMYFPTMSCTGDQLIERFMAAAAKAASEAGSTTQSIHLLGRLAEAAAFSGDLARSEAFARMAVAKGGGDTRGTWRATAARAMCDFFRGRAAASDSTYREIVNGLSTQPTPTVVDLISNWAVVRMELEKFEEARHDLEYCRDFYQATRHPVAAARAQGNLAALEWEAGNHAIASGRAEETLASGSWLPSEVVATAMGVAGMVEVETRWESAVERRRRLLASWPDQLLMQSDLSYAYMFLARMSEREGKRADALERIEDGLALYAGRDFFCHARLQLEKARLIGVKDPEAGLALAREVRARALEGEATLLLNKSEALIRELKRGTQARAQGGGRTEAGAGARKKIMPRMTRRHPGDSDQSK